MTTSRHTHAVPSGAPVLGEAEAVALAERFKLLADPTRLRMIHTLVEAGELCVNAIASAVDASESATSHQLRQMRLAGLVRSRRDGREVMYAIADSHVRLLIDLAVEHYLHDHPVHA